MKRFILTVRMPLLAELINSSVAQFGGVEYGIFAFPLVTAAIAFWAGFLVSKESWGSLAHAGWAGPFILFWGVIIAGVCIALSGPLGPDELKDIPERARHAWVLENPRLTVVAGIVFSSAMLVPIAALISVFGGILSKRIKSTRGVGSPET